ncbi:MAG: DNA translocase FtsK 4TM domain-containing protein [Hyphomicrobiaceae bacterium]
MYVERSGLEPRPLLPQTLEDRLLGLVLKVTGLALVLLALAGWLSLLTWSASDPSLTHTTGGAARNLLGPVGAIFSDLVLQTVGFAAVVVFLGPAWIGGELMLNERLLRARARFFLFVLSVGVISGAISSIPTPASWPLKHGLGGAIGDLVFGTLAGVAGLALPGAGSALIGLILFAGGMTLLCSALGIGQRELSLLARVKSEPSLRASSARIVPQHRPDVQMGAEVAFDGDRSDAAALDSWCPTSQPEPASTVRHRQPAATAAPYSGGAAAYASAQPIAPAPPAQEPVLHEPVPETAFDRMTDVATGSIAARFAPDKTDKEGSRPDKVKKTAPKKPSEILGRVMSFRPAPSEYRRPSLNILKRPPPARPGPEHTQPVLRGSARLLEDVLGDFGIKGEVKGIKPGPVVTLFELEPARGTKASRIIALSDDIARSMSAVSARVAPVSGRDLIGIELPNVRREMVYLRELFEHEAWRTADAQLPVVLGKGIGGEPIIADLARMPHLLVAGTTGSGKSVGVNALVLSLLYRLSPAECRFVMIDPKMLELSVYNGIPHLLAPVVTDPHRAAAALGWVVAEMEERYKRMSELGVRNIDMFNVRVKNARKRGELIGRTVQTGFDEATGEALYAREDRVPEPMPYIVVIVDEFADLMSVAGKEIEGIVQRLAQMARAAGIHLVMATQRPSVDVVTGTIKANFPTRIAFKVASKIDSRTILGEQGAEQLLGSGDMLFSPGSGQTMRVHGPFVSDDEVEAVASALRANSEPDYVEALAIKLEAEPAAGASHVGAPAPVSADDLFDRAVAIVHRDGKASTSYLQRRLGIGYNRAADLIERMEADGLVSPADSVGRRRVLIGREDGADAAG